MTKKCIINILKNALRSDTMKFEHKMLITEAMVKSIIEVLKESEPKKGEWIIVTDSRGQHAECPYCGEWKYHQNQKFCGECGCKMEVEE